MRRVLRRLGACVIGSLVVCNTEVLLPSPATVLSASSRKEAFSRHRSDDFLKSAVDKLSMINYDSLSVCFPSDHVPLLWSFS